MEGSLAARAGYGLGGGACLGLLVGVLAGCQARIADPPAGLDEAPGCADALADPGHVPLRRLSRADYRRTVRDLLGAEILEHDPTEAFPPDESAFGFDNMGAAQRITAAHFSRYFDASRGLAHRALGSPRTPIDVVVEAEEAGAFSSYGGTVDRDAADHPGTIYFIQDGTVSSDPLPLADGLYEVAVRAFAQLENVAEGADVRILEGGLEVGRFYVDSSTPETYTRPVRLVTAIEPIRVSLVNHARRGPLLPFVDDTCDDCATADRVCHEERCRSLEPCATDADCAPELSCLDGVPGAPAGGHCAHPHVRRVLFLDRFTVRGPIDAPDPDPVRMRLVRCDPDATGREACAREVLSRLAPRAWRRPLEDDELDRLVALAMHEEATDFDTGMQAALSALFLSPNFLFRIEDGGGEGVRPLSEHEVATRLSYLLWGSTPDSRLLDLAAAGELTASLAEQVDRMLRDDRAAGLTEGFVGQWLSTRTLRDRPLDRDPLLHPGFDFGVQRSMAAEIEHLFAAHLAEERPVTALLTTDHGYVDRRLRVHYGLPPATSDADDFARADLAAVHRGGGLLTSGGLLALNAMRQRTSIVGRGNWVLGTLLCAPPPEPPADLDTSLPDDPDPGTTLREQMARHRADPACAGCHEGMDNIGFGLEAFDAVGRFRTTDAAGNALDTTGELPDGTRFDGAEELADALADDPRFATCVTRKLATYATGRSYLASADVCALEALVERAGGEEATLRSLTHALVESPLFLSRREP